MDTINFPQLLRDRLPLLEARRTQEGTAIADCEMAQQWGLKYADPAAQATIRECMAELSETVHQIHLLEDTEAAHVSRLLEVFDPPENATILDAGCGIGGVAQHMKRARPDLDFILLNVSSAQLELCPAGLPTVHASFEDIPLPDACVDAVMFNYSLGHGRIDLALKEAARVLRPEGLLFIYDLSTEESARLIVTLGYNAHSVTRVIDEAERSGFGLTRVYTPESFAITGALQKIPKPAYLEMFEGIKSTLYRFIKVPPGHVAEPQSAIAHALGTHKNVALQLSGGKDSLACLYLLRAHWDAITVVWLNTGAAYPETIEQMERIRAMVPHFLEVKADQPKQVRENGFPVDVVPIRNTGLGKQVQANDDLLLQSFMNCCWANLWKPMQDAMVEMGATLLIRGQRANEVRKAPITNGHTENGVTVWLPIERWTKRQVFDYLKAQGVDIPAHYEYTQTSLDCWSCTAYLDENAGRMRYMRAKHPALWADLEQRLTVVRGAIQGELRHLDAALDDTDA